VHHLDNLFGNESKIERMPFRSQIYRVRQTLADRWNLSPPPDVASGMSIRPVRDVTAARPTLEGAGVRLDRAFGFDDTRQFDPFLLLDDFRNERPEDYRAGFPWHPHRGIETITYVLAGTVEHADSLGNSGVVGPGDVQWMTAGSGIIHQEMPAGDANGRMHGFQLWANLPAAKKMTAPRYQDIAGTDVPEVTDDDGTSVRVVCGDFWGVRGPVEGIAADPRYLDVSVPSNRRKRLKVETERHAFAYVFAGSGSFVHASDPLAVPTEDLATGQVTLTRTGNRSLVLFDRGDEIVVEAGDDGMRFLLVSGRPLREPVAWHGPIVMNSAAELRQAYAELDEGTFLRSKS
jgi:redox-sensitive bicupin YhaK (pirin superfamily)